ncbi:MAG TPA: lysoplasmalogenase family protein, partial [Mycobacteriales bacterium]|nr:lysoplasmalogenase family protein [Mycobacteriales bacterium]
MITTAGRVPGGVRDRVPAGVAGRVPGGVLARVAGYVPGGMAGRVAGGVAATVAVADAVLAGSGRRRARWLTKPALVPAIALATGVRPSGPAAVALAGSWAGDVALLSRSEAGLLGGIGGFAIAHAAYLKAIRALPPGPRSAGPGPAAAGPATAGPATEGPATEGPAGPGPAGPGPAGPGPAGVGPAGASPGARG